MADKDRISEILSDNGDMDPELLEKISNSCNTLSDEQKNRIFDIVQQKEFADNSENQYEESVNVVEYRRFSMIKYIAAIAACACVILSVSIFSGRNKENILSGNDKVRVTTVCVTERPETSAFTDVSVSPLLQLREYPGCAGLRRVRRRLRHFENRVGIIILDGSLYVHQVIRVYKYATGFHRGSPEISQAVDFHFNHIAGVAGHNG